MIGEYLIGHIYYYFLGFIYFLSTDHLFIGSLVSSLAWILSAFILIKIMRILSFDMSNQWKVMFFYSVLPSSIMYTSVPLREPFQLLFVNLAIYAALKIYFHKSIHWLTLLFSIIGMGLLHGALMPVGVFILVSSLFLIIIRNRKKISLTKFLLISPLIGLSLFYGLLAFNNLSYGLDEFVKTLEQYQNATASMGARSTYLVIREYSHLFDVIISFPYLFFQYLFEPMLWNMSSIIDLIALVENLLRVFLIWNILKYFIVISREKYIFNRSIFFENRRMIFFIFLSLLVTEIIWSLGTVNWATSMRHHIPSFGLLLIVGYSYKNIRFLNMNNQPRVKL